MMVGSFNSFFVILVTFIVAYLSTCTICPYFVREIQCFECIRRTVKLHMGNHKIHHHIFFQPSFHSVSGVSGDHTFAHLLCARSAQWHAHTTETRRKWRRPWSVTWVCCIAHALLNHFRFQLERNSNVSL